MIFGTNEARDRSGWNFHKTSFFSADWREEGEERAGLARRSTREEASPSSRDYNGVKWDPSPGFVVNQARKTLGDISICRDLGRLREYRLSAEQTCKQTTPSIFPSPFSCCTRRHDHHAFCYHLISQPVRHHTHFQRRILRSGVSVPGILLDRCAKPLPFLTQARRCTRVCLRCLLFAQTVTLIYP